MHTVMGLRAQRQRAALAAHPEGELFRRMSEGTDLIPLAREMRSIWQPRGGFACSSSSRPDVIHAHDPHGVAMAATALSMASPSPELPLVASRRIEFRIAHNSFSRWRYRTRRLFHRNQRGRSRSAHRGRHPEAEDHRSSMRASTSSASCTSGGQRTCRIFPYHAPVVGNIGALVAQKGQHHLVDAAAIVLRAVPDARFVILGEGELRPALEEQIKRKHLERHVFLAGFRPDVLELLKGVDLFALSPLQEGLVHVAGRRDGSLKGVCGDACGRGA